MPKVSVIVPVYRVEKYIERCIQSIQNQTITDWELILIDDCSPDGSYDIISGYAKQDKRIIVKKQESNHGPMMARRGGDEISNGEYITYCDGDDILPNDALQKLYDAAISTNADIVSGNITCIKGDGSRSDIISSIKNGCDGESLLKALLKHEMPQALCAKLFKSELVKTHDYKVIDHMTNAEDGYILYQMIPYVKTVIQLPDVVYYYMQNYSSSSQRRYSQNALNNILMMNSLRVSLINDFPSLKKDILRCVSDALTGLIIDGYNDDGQLVQMMEKHNLLQYSGDKTILKTHTLLDSTKLLFRKHIHRS